MGYIYNQDIYYTFILGLFQMGVVGLMAFTIWRFVVKLLINPVIGIFPSWNKKIDTGAPKM